MRLRDDHEAACGAPGGRRSPHPRSVGAGRGPERGPSRGDAFGIPPEPLPREVIDTVADDGRDLPRPPAPITVKVQVPLDQAGMLPGVIDGRRWGPPECALRAFERREGLVASGILDPGVQDRLGGPTAGPVRTGCTTTLEDTQDLSPEIPEDFAGRVDLPVPDHRRVSARLAEPFHMDEDVWWPSARRRASTRGKR